MRGLDTDTRPCLLLFPSRSRVAFSRRGVYDVHKAYNELSETPADGPVPWIPIDYSLPTEDQEKNHRVPGTFEPKGIVLSVLNL